MKRRVIAIAVVLAVVGIVVLCWEPLYRAVVLKRLVDSDGDSVTIAYVPRWEEAKSVWSKNCRGPLWSYNKRFGMTTHTEIGHGRPIPGSTFTRWAASGEVTEQGKISKTPNVVTSFVDTGNYSLRFDEVRDSPPWWPHPPLIDLREFEE